jgi:hypothetical protein
VEPPLDPATVPAYVREHQLREFTAQRRASAPPT